MVWRTRRCRNAGLSPFCLGGINLARLRIEEKESFFHGCRRPTNRGGKAAERRASPGNDNNTMYTGASEPCAVCHTPGLVRHPFAFLAFPGVRSSPSPLSLASLPGTLTPYGRGKCLNAMSLRSLFLCNPVVGDKPFLRVSPGVFRYRPPLSPNGFDLPEWAWIK